VSVLLVVAGADAGTGPSLFPLADGNRWTLRDLKSGTASTITARRSGAVFILRAFPGAGTVRVRGQGEGVEAWDAVDRRWEPFLRLGAPAGTRYLVDLRGTTFWEDVDVTVASRRAVVRDARGRALRGCVRLTFSYRVGIADAGLEVLAFAPGVGPVFASEQSIEGPRESTLASFTLR
jgi:hypothetical protein